MVTFFYLFRSLTIVNVLHNFYIASMYVASLLGISLDKALVKGFNTVNHSAKIVRLRQNGHSNVMSSRSLAESAARNHANTLK